MKKDCISASNACSRQFYRQHEETRTFLYSGSSIFWIIELSSLRIALADTPVAADLKSWRAHRVSPAFSELDMKSPTIPCNSRARCPGPGALRDQGEELGKPRQGFSVRGR